MKVFIGTVILTALFFGCKKESFITSPDAQLTFTVDTIKYDTVFTTTGSVTKSFKIINENDQRLRISEVRLMGGNSSQFRINVDGYPGPVVSGLEIAADDSLYVFVTVNVDPSTANLPFVIRDSIQITWNGNTHFVQLEAWGQNAHFYRNKVVTATETWNNDLPYVILGALTIDTNATLIINKGTRIFVHADAPVIVDGTLIVNGEKDTIDHVVFRGDRMDEPYRDFPASWPGIFFRGSSINNVLTYSEIRNAYQAIALTDPATNSTSKLTLNECIIDNAYDAGIISVNSSIRARNSLITNCGKNIVLAKGGDYQFIHCTVASYSTSFMIHRDPVLFVTNFIPVNNVPVTSDLNAIFRNCIFWGDNGVVPDEVVVLKSGTTVFNVNFDHNLWKVQNAPANVITNQVINNQDPEFDSVNTNTRFYNFRLKPTSIAINKGTMTPVVLDLDGKPRNVVGSPDLGAFENQ